MEKLECIIVNGPMPSVSSSSSLSSPWRFVLIYWCSWWQDCSQTRWIITNVSTCSGRTMIGDHGDVTVTLLKPNLEETEEDKRSSIFTRTQSHIVYNGHIPHADIVYHISWISVRCVYCDLPLKTGCIRTFLVWRDIPYYWQAKKWGN